MNHGPFAVIAPGDVEDTAWNDMISAGALSKANVLIASHHGRNNGYNEASLDIIDPEVVTISSDVIPAKDDAIKRYGSRATVFSTRETARLPSACAITKPSRSSTATGTSSRATG